ncbi:unnamed protein product [Closterium sp. NIES-65]|nr:unnamed protein product [Closterium sp. NIES-65]
MRSTTTSGAAAMLVSNCPENAASAAAGMSRWSAAGAATSTCASSLDSLSRFITASSLPFACHSPSQRSLGTATVIRAGSSHSARPGLLEQTGLPSSPSCTFQVVAGPEQVGLISGADFRAHSNNRRSGAGVSVAGAGPPERASAVMGARDSQLPATANVVLAEDRDQRLLVPGGTRVNTMANLAAQGVHVTPIGRAVRGVGEWMMSAGGGSVMTPGMTACRILVPRAEQAHATGLASCSSSWGLPRGQASGSVEPPMANSEKEAVQQQLWMQQLGLREQKEEGMSARDGGADKAAQTEVWAAAMAAGGREQEEAAGEQVEAGRAWHSDKELMAQQMMALQALLASGDFSALAQFRGEGLPQHTGQQQQQQQQAGQQCPDGMRQQQPTRHEAQGDGTQDGLLEGSGAQGWDEEGPVGRGLVAAIVRQSSMQVGAETHAAQAQRALEEAAKRNGGACSEVGVSVRVHDEVGPGEGGPGDDEKAGGGGMAEASARKWRHEMGMISSSLIGRGMGVGGKEMKGPRSMGLRDGVFGSSKVGGEGGASSGSDGDDVDDAWGQAGTEDGAFMDGMSGGHGMVAARGSSAAAEDTEVAGANSDDLALEWSRRMRRMKSNRESAKRARIKRQRRLQELEVLTSSLQRENADLSQQVVALSQQMQQSEAQKEELEKEVAALRACALALGSGGAATPTAPVTHSTQSPHTAPNPFILPPSMSVTADAAHYKPTGGDRARQTEEATTAIGGAQDTRAEVGEGEVLGVASVDAAVLAVCMDKDSVTDFV